jgi:hypothetical protein
VSLRESSVTRRALLAAAIAIPGSVLAACIDGEELDATLPAPEAPTVTVEPSATFTSVVPATATPTATSSPTPTATPTATSTPSPTPTITPTPVPHRSPLTGLPLDEPARKPLAIQINNEPARRPQTSIQNADIVYEAPTESAVTRFTAFFGATIPDDIGPVRSVRVVALELVPAHDGILVYSGGSIDMTAAVFASGLPAIHAEGNGVAASRREPSRVAPHNLYVSGPKTYDVAQELGFAGTSQAQSFTFGPLPSGGMQSSGVTIPFTSGEVDFFYNPTLLRYERSVDHQPQLDLVTQQRLRFDNVVLLYAPFAFMDFVDDFAGETTLGVNLRGEGKAGIFRDRRYYEALWRRPDYQDVFRFFDPSDGRELPLKTGQIWFTILPEWLPDVTRHP